MLQEDATNLRFLDISEVIGMMIDEINEDGRLMELPIVPTWSIRLVHVLCRSMSIEAEMASVRRLVRALYVRTIGLYRTPDGETILHLAVTEASSLVSDDVISDLNLRKILRVSWTAKKTNEWVLNKAGVKRELLDTVKARKLA